jgi:D-3-phosphoglycerate dehydrogenase
VYCTDYDYADLNIENNIYSNYDVKFIPLRCKSEDDLISLARDADGLHNQYLKITEKTFKNLKNLKVIARYGVGLDSIDLEQAKINNVKVKNVPDYCVDEVSNHCLCMLLSFLRKLKRSDSMVRDSIWDFNKLRPIHEFGYYTIGIIGFGKIGSALGTKLISLGFNKILVYDIDRQVIEKLEFKDKVFSSELDTLLSTSDFIVLNLPLNKNTYHLIDKDKINLFKSDATIINASRGGIISEIDLFNFLKNNPDSNAGLDVLEQEGENVKKNELLKLDNVIFSPHIAYYSEEALVRLRRSTSFNVLVELLGNIIEK